MLSRLVSAQVWVSLAVTATRPLPRSATGTGVDRKDGDVVLPPSWPLASFPQHCNRATRGHRASVVQTAAHCERPVRDPAYRHWVRPVSRRSVANLAVAVGSPARHRAAGGERNAQVWWAPAATATMTLESPVAGPGVARSLVVPSRRRPLKLAFSPAPPRRSSGHTYGSNRPSTPARRS